MNKYVHTINCRQNRKRDGFPLFLMPSSPKQTGTSFPTEFSTVKSRIPLDQCFSTCHLFQFFFSKLGTLNMRQKIMCFCCYCRVWECYPWSFLSKATDSIWVGYYNYIYADAEPSYNKQKPRLLFSQTNAEKLELAINLPYLWTE